MANFVFILCLTGLIGLLFCWSFRHLPQERWQIFGAVPRIKLADGNWQGVNFTYYGLLTANACVFAAILFFVLLASAGLRTLVIFLVTAMVFSICVPASRLIARWVEHKAFTFFSAFVWNRALKAWTLIQLICFGVSLMRFLLLSVLLLSILLSVFCIYLERPQIAVFRWL